MLPVLPKEIQEIIVCLLKWYLERISKASQGVANGRGGERESRLQTVELLPCLA